MMCSAMRKGQKCGNEPTRKLGLRALSFPSIDPAPNQDLLLPARLGSPCPLVVETSYPGNQGLHSPGVVLTVLCSLKDSVLTGGQNKHTTHHHTTTTHHILQSVPETTLETQDFGVMLDSAASMLTRAI